MFLKLFFMLQIVCASQCLDGGWSVWLPWGPCTTTVLGNVRSRDRQCDNPPASALGKDCQGPQTERSRCPAPTTTMSTIATNGVWSAWLSWGACSATCNGGMQSRTRSCINLAASQFSRDCQGTDFMQQLCNTQNCPETNGAWSVWSPWGTCSATCNGGLQSRTRTCTNPAPSQFGRECSGNDVDKHICNSKNCLEKAVAFSVHSPTGSLVRYSPIFSITLVNTGCYNQATGKFTCPVAGIYSFSVSLEVDKSDTSDVYCNYRVNGGYQAYVRSYQDAVDTSSSTMVVALHLGDVVDLSCGGWDHVDHSYTTAFNGVLITPT